MSTPYQHLLHPHFAAAEGANRPLLGWRNFRPRLGIACPVPIPNSLALFDGVGRINLISKSDDLDLYGPNLLHLVLVLLVRLVVEVVGQSPLPTFASGHRSRLLEPNPENGLIAFVRSSISLFIEGILMKHIQMKFILDSEL